MAGIILMVKQMLDCSAEPNRMSAHKSSHSSGVQQRLVYLLTIAIVVLFVVMDICTVVHIQRSPPRRENPTAIEQFDFFAMLSVKGILEDHYSSYIIWPTTEWFDQRTHLSSLPWITPNGVSIFGLFVGILAMRIMLMESITCKRIGVLIFCFRLWLDGLDGVVFRMQRLSGAEKHTQLSVRHSSGWFVDTVCDFGAGFMFVYAVYRTLKQSMPSAVSQLPLMSSRSQGNSNGKEVSSRSMLIKVFWVIVVVSSASALWDYFVDQYRKVFEVTLETTELQDLQSSLMKSFPTMVLFWSWKLMNGVSLINMAYLATVYEKLWEYLTCLQYLGTLLLVVLAILTYIHQEHLRVMLLKPSL